MRFQFIHAADLHLDTPFTGMSRVDPSLVTVLRDATTQAFENLVTVALERKVAFLVIAGDIYDGPERGVRAQLAFRNGLDRLARAGIPSFVVRGNHDPEEKDWSAIRIWPDGVTMFGSGNVATVPVERDGQTLALIHGISYPRKAVTENLALRYRRTPANCLQIGLLHCNVGANTEHAPHSPCSIDELVAVGLDYWALGHIHLRQCLHDGGPWIAYPGNLQGLSPKPSERGAKGALLVDVDDGRVSGVEFLALDVVRFDAFTIDVAGIEDLASLIDELVQRARERALTHDGRKVVLRVSLTGRGAVHRDLRLRHVRDYVLIPARTILATATQDVWLDAVEDHTNPEVDVEAIRGRGDFASEVVKTVDLLLPVPELRSNLIASHLDDLPGADLRRLLDGAVDSGPDVDSTPTDEEIRGALEVALDRTMEVE